VLSFLSSKAPFLMKATRRKDFGLAWSLIRPPANPFQRAIGLTGLLPMRGQLLRRERALLMAAFTPLKAIPQAVWACRNTLGRPGNPLPASPLFVCPDAQCSRTT